jgi:hypothetical protein
LIQELIDLREIPCDFVLVHSRGHVMANRDLICLLYFGC